MIINAGQIARELKHPLNADDPLIITPSPDLEELKKSGSASIDLRLGCWFLACRASRTGLLDVYKSQDVIPSEAKLTKSYYVPFGDGFVLHPRAFVLGVTLEWIRLPTDRSAMVIGRSSWGRHGLIIATATGVHPGFTGCLTLELSNVGEIPIMIKPGTTICQIFIHKVEGGDPKFVDQSSFIGSRKPTLGAIKLDEIARLLANDDFNNQ
ncbi:MAG: dCTP deaminase [Candidatus Electryonea clarkiae]|nr:dCTP deaminase [Candidatus Electryonea clarkiae]MDP8288973.1 dCTP deaminase [Candidatus Electryonea clarkiae]